MTSQAKLQHALCNSMHDLLYSDKNPLQRRIATSPAIMTKDSDQPCIVYVEYHEEVRTGFLYRELRLFVTGSMIPQDVLRVGEGALKLALAYKMIGKFLSQMEIL